MAKKYLRYGALLVTISPFLAWLIMAFVSAVLDCSVNAAGSNHCILSGTDLGPLLYTLGVYVRMAIYLFPIYLIFPVLVFALKD